MAEIECSVFSNIIYFKLPAEKGNIQKNRYCRIWDTGSGHLLTPFVVLNCYGKKRYISFEARTRDLSSQQYSS